MHGTHFNARVNADTNVWCKHSLMVQSHWKEMETNAIVRIFVHLLALSAVLAVTIFPWWGGATSSPINSPQTIQGDILLLAWQAPQPTPTETHVVLTSVLWVLYNNEYYKYLISIYLNSICESFTFWQRWPKLQVPWRLFSLLGSLPLDVYQALILMLHRNKRKKEILLNIW